MLLAEDDAEIDASEYDWHNGYIGRSQFSRDPFYSGSLNELRIYDHALSEEEVVASLKAGPNAKIE